MPGNESLRKYGAALSLAAGICGLVLTGALAAQLIDWGFHRPGFGYWRARLFGLLFHIGAVWMIALAGWHVARGRGFGVVVPRLLISVGALLALAAIHEVFGVALLLRIFGQGEFHTFAIFDPNFVALGVVGLLLILVGCLMRRAEQMAQELEEFV